MRRLQLIDCRLEFLLAESVFRSMIFIADETTSYPFHPLRIKSSSFRPFLLHLWCLPCLSCFYSVNTSRVNNSPLHCRNILFIHCPPADFFVSLSLFNTLLTTSWLVFGMRSRRVVFMFSNSTTVNSHSLK